jgi:uncharacterized protein YwqG
VSGALFAFGDELCGGDPDLVRVLHAPEFGPAPRCAPATLPAKRRHPERRVSFLKFASIPSLDWLAEDVREIEVDEQELDALADAPGEPFGDELQHRVGGYPAEIQDAQMAIEAEYASRGQTRDHREPTPRDVAKAAKDWRLLLQIDSDPALRMSWGDAGRLYVFIREGDARAADFSRTVTLWQCY